MKLGLRTHWHEVLEYRVEWNRLGSIIWLEVVYTTINHSLTARNPRWVVSPEARDIPVCLLEFDLGLSETHVLDELCQFWIEVHWARVQALALSLAAAVMTTVLLSRGLAFWFFHWQFN
jgi:hypothetical protein